MKKVITIHLNDKMFQIEEDAYAYLNSALSGQWKKQELEAQLCERFSQNLAGGKTVIIYPDVVEALYQLGVSAAEHQSPWFNLRDKRLYRQPVNKMIGGICTGLGEYFDIDPVIVRVLFVIALFLGTMGFWLYVILWIVIPKSPRTLFA